MSNLQQSYQPPEKFTLTLWVKIYDIIQTIFLWIFANDFNYFIGVTYIVQNHSHHSIPSQTFFWLSPVLPIGREYNPIISFQFIHQIYSINRILKSSKSEQSLISMDTSHYILIMFTYDKSLQFFIVRFIMKWVPWSFFFLSRIVDRSILEEWRRLYRIKGKTIRIYLVF